VDDALEDAMRSCKLLIYGAVILAGILSFGCLAAQLAKPAILEWSPNGPKPEGYRLYRRFAGEAYDYSAPIYQGPEIRFVAACPAGKTCFWVVRAYKGEHESGDSNEVSLAGPKERLP
jgi:hypothetical protein